MLAVFFSTAVLIGLCEAVLILGLCGHKTREGVQIPFFTRPTLVYCNAFPEKWKWCRFNCSNQHGWCFGESSGRRRLPIYTRGYQRQRQILKKEEWDSKRKSSPAICSWTQFPSNFFSRHVGLTTCLGPVHLCFNPLSCCLRCVTTLFVLYFK